MRRALIATIVCALAIAFWQSEPSQAEGEPFTIANYPVDAIAENAALAQQQALAEGRKAALHSLFKRLLPVTAWSSLPKLQSVDPTRLISRVAVRSAENSSTQYVASLDFTFDADGVRDVLRRHSLPFIDEQAANTVLVTLFVAPDASSKSGLKLVSGGREPKTWSTVWHDLDLKNSLAPVVLTAPKPTIDSNAVLAARAGDPKLLTLLATAYGVPQVVLAVAEQDARARRLKVTLAGQDASGPFVLTRTYPYRQGELTYVMEMAAVIGLGTLEGRWKAMQSASSGGASAAGPLEPVQVFVEFRSMQQWRQLREQIAGTPGVRDLQVGGISSVGADLALRFPGGGQRLATTLAGRGILLQEDRGTWVARRNY